MSDMYTGKHVVCGINNMAHIARDGDKTLCGRYWSVTTPDRRIGCVVCIKNKNNAGPVIENVQKGQVYRDLNNDRVFEILPLIGDGYIYTQTILCAGGKEPTRPQSSRIKHENFTQNRFAEVKNA